MVGKRNEKMIVKKARETYMNRFDAEQQRKENIARMACDLLVVASKGKNITAVRIQIAVRIAEQIQILADKTKSVY